MGFKNATSSDRRIQHGARKTIAGGSHHMELRATHNAGQEICRRFNFGSKLTPLYEQQANTTLQPVNTHHSTTTYTNPYVVDTELGKEITAGWIINDHINIIKAKIDLKAAFHLIPVRAVDWVHLGMDRTCLPFGLRSSLSLINNYADALHWIMASYYGAQLLPYLDDFLLVGPPGKDTCQEAMYRVLLVCDQLGIPVASEKLKGPTTTLTTLGIVINTSAQQLRLPP
eukprot:Em0062g3a